MHRRIRWTKRLLRPLPRKANLHRYPVLKWFAKEARARPYLWSFRQSTMTPTFYVGCVLALLPTYGMQIAIAFVAALLIRGNLPTMIGLQLITNPFTVVAIYPVTYTVGSFLIELVDHHPHDGIIGHAVYALFVGGIACGLVLGLMLDLVYRLFRYEASKHHWHLPRNRHRPEPFTAAAPSAEPAPAPQPPKTTVADCTTARNMPKTPAACRHLPD